MRQEEWHWAACVKHELAGEELNKCQMAPVDVCRRGENRCVPAIRQLAV